MALSEKVFSIIVPCFNHVSYLRDAVVSVQNQQFQSWELIIVNDGSTDGSAQLADELASFDQRIIVIHQTNQGLSVARNIGLEKANGQFLGFLDADDIYLPGAFDSIYNFFLKMDVDLLIGGYSYFTENDFLHSHSFFDNALLPFILLQNNQAPPVAHFLRREISLLIGGFDSSLKSCEDWDYWIRVAKFGGKIRTIPDVIAGYRYVPTSMSRNPRQMFEALSEVSRRAFRRDLRLPDNSIFNFDSPIDLATVQKHHLIRCLGILIHLGKVQEATQWFNEERIIWNWELSFTDWQGLSSALTWKYFLGKENIQDVFLKVKPSLGLFFSELGYSGSEIKQLVSQVLKPQRFRMNHYRYGKWLGALINRIIG